MPFRPAAHGFVWSALSKNLLFRRPADNKASVSDRCCWFLAAESSTYRPTTPRNTCLQPTRKLRTISRSSEEEPLLPKKLPTNVSVTCHRGERSIDIGTSNSAAARQLTFPVASVSRLAVRSNSHESDIFLYTCTCPCILCHHITGHAVACVVYAL